MIQYRMEIFNLFSIGVDVEDTNYSISDDVKIYGNGKEIGGLKKNVVINHELSTEETDHYRLYLVKEANVTLEVATENNNEYCEILIN